MRHMSMPVLAIFLTMIVLTFGGCDKKPVLPTASASGSFAPNWPKPASALPC